VTTLSIACATSRREIDGLFSSNDRSCVSNEEVTLDRWCVLLLKKLEPVKSILA